MDNFEIGRIKKQGQILTECVNIVDKLAELDSADFDFEEFNFTKDVLDKLIIKARTLKKNNGLIWD